MMGRRRIVREFDVWSVGLPGNASWCCGIRLERRRAMSSHHPEMMTPERARRMFRRVLSAWAVDSLRLRRCGLDVPSARHLLRRADGTRSGPFGGAGASFSADDAQERAA